MHLIPARSRRKALIHRDGIQLREVPLDIDMPNAFADTAAASATSG
jgi:hypothetical protein